MPLGGKNALEGMREAGPYIGLGFQLFAAILLFTGGGYWLDAQLGTLPGLTLVGAAASFAMILYLVLRIAKDADARSARSKPPPASDDSSSGRPGSKKRAPDSSASSRGPDFHSGHKRRVSGKE
jgi:hypothetical protein